MDYKYQCGSCEAQFNELNDNVCPDCLSGNWITGLIDDLEVQNER